MFEGRDELTRRDDGRALAVVCAIAALSLVVQTYAKYSETLRFGVPIGLTETWLLESTSHIAIVVVAALLPSLLALAPLKSGSWVRAAPALAGGFVAFTLCHIGLMYIARLMLFPLVLGRAYETDLFAPRNLYYEVGKDILYFPVLLLAFVVARTWGTARRAAAEAVKAAAANHRIRLKAGSGWLIIPSQDVLWAKAAGNYAEVRTSTKTHFCRTTLTELARLLTDAGGDHVRIHKSYLVSPGAISALAPTGEGDLTVTLANGETIPCSRRYKSALADLQS